MRRVIVHIDRLVLTGFRHEDRQAIAAGLQDELGRVFSDRDAVSLLESRGDLPRLQVGGMNIGPQVAPQHVGENVAQHIGQEIKK